METKTINRSAKSGKFVTAKKAKRNPNTTVKETIRNDPYTKHRQYVINLLREISTAEVLKPSFRSRAKEIVNRIDNA